MSIRVLSKTYWRGTQMRFRKPVNYVAVCEQAKV